MGVSAVDLAAELELLERSPMILNRGLREAVCRAASLGVSGSELIIGRSLVRVQAGPFLRDQSRLTGPWRDETGFGTHPALTRAASLRIRGKIQSVPTWELRMQRAWPGI